MSNFPKKISDALQQDIDALYKSVAFELEGMLTQHLEPITCRANNGGNYRRIQPLLSDLEGIQRRLQAIQALERVQRFDTSELLAESENSGMNNITP
jgi:hypothetical protein